MFRFVKREAYILEVIVGIMMTLYTSQSTSLMEVQLLLPFKRHIYPCDEDVVSLRCNSVGEVQHLTANVTMLEVNVESQSLRDFNFNRGDGEQVSSHQGVVQMSGRVVVVLHNYSVVNETERIFQYHSDVMLKYSSKSVTKAVINCSTGVNYAIKELSLSSIPNHPQLSYTVAETHSHGQVVNIHWQEPDNSGTYDLDYYLITVQPGDKVYSTKDTIISINFNEGMYNVSIIAVNRCGDNSSAQPEHIRIEVRAEIPKYEQRCDIHILISTMMQCVHTMAVIGILTLLIIFLVLSWDAMRNWRRIMKIEGKEEG